MPLPDNELDGLAALLAPAIDLLVPAGNRADLPPLAIAPDTAAVKTWLAAMSDAQTLALLARLPEPPHPRAVSARARLDARAHAAVVAGAPHQILHGMPVVDRVEIWSRLLSMQAGALRILTIRGEERTGKTYSKWLVVEFCNRLGPPHEAPLPFDLDGARSLEAIAADIVGAIGGQESWPKFNDAHSTPKKWGGTVARNVYQQVTRTGRIVWLVFDHFERATKSDEAIAFFSVLAEQVALETGLGKEGPRLVLIDHGVDVPPVARGITAGEEVRLATLSDIEVFVRACRPALAPGDAQAEALRIHGALQPTTYMEDLGAAVMALIQPLPGGGG